jgi:DNA-binding MarR family transcriptional regulator/GNAT superfamily N-acetyltransferase
MSTTLPDPPPNPWSSSPTAAASDREAQISAAREFSRFYSAKLGMTRSSVYRTQFTLAEARVLYELGAGVTAVAALRRRTAMDGGQLSRLLKRLEADGVIERLPSSTDRRKQTVRLTGDGEDAFAALDETSREEVGALLDEAADPAGAVAAMEQLKRALEPGQRSVAIRGPQPGDLGWLVERHGALYAREYGWDTSFERLVARIAAEFDPQHDRAWIAEVDDKRAGAVLCVHHDETTAKLRTLLVEPSARGLGLGTSLVNKVIEHARSRGYTTLTLWTNDVLHAARHIYEKTGFTLQGEAPHHAFGHALVEQTWSLTLHPWTETR